MKFYDSLTGVMITVLDWLTGGVIVALMQKYMKDVYKDVNIWQKLLTKSTPK